MGTQRKIAENGILKEIKVFSLSISIPDITNNRIEHIERKTNV
jgi:hypothetical protein